MYVGTHSAIGRVKLKKVLNPSVMSTRETYLRAEVEEVVDSDADADCTAAEEKAKAQFLELVDAQIEMEEEPRFTEAVKAILAFDRGGDYMKDKDDKGLWGTIQIWQQFLEQRAQVVGNKMQREIQKEVMDYLKNNEIDSNKVNARGEMRLEDLPAPLISNIKSIQQRFREIQKEVMDYLKNNE